MKIDSDGVVSRLGDEELLDVRPVFVRSAFNYNTDLVSLATGLVCDEDTLTQQNQREDADINVIVKRFGLTGALPQSVRVPSYQDFEDVFDFRTAMDAINSARDSFMAMDADTRYRFRNDPQIFVDFCSDPANLEEMRKMGLAVPAKVPEPEAPPMKVQVVNSDAPPQEEKGKK